MVSTSRSRTIGEEEADIVAIGIQAEEGDFEGEVYKKNKNL